MFNFICKSFPHLKHSLRISPPHKFQILQLYLLSTTPTKKSSKPISENENQHSFTVNYLISTCGFAPEKAITASKYVNFDKPDNPEAVKAFLISKGFTNTQITSLVRRFPPVILCDPVNTLLPKIEFFESKGFEKDDIALILTRTPNIFKRSLENQIIPAFDLLSSLIQSKDKTLSSLKRFGYMLCCDLHTSVLPNIELLREIAVPESNIGVILTYQPRDMIMDNTKFKLIVEEVKEMGFHPSQLKFLIAIHAFRAMSKLTWEKKVDVYKQWGWSKDEVLVAFGKHPWCMMASEDKITKVMDFFVNKMGFESSVLLKRPALVSLSLDKRIIPRCVVYQFLTSNGLARKALNLNMFLELPETKFLKKYVESYADKAPGLLKLYQKKLALSD